MGRKTNEKKKKTQKKKKNLNKSNTKIVVVVVGLAKRKNLTNKVQQRDTFYKNKRLTQKPFLTGTQMYGGGW